MILASLSNQAPPLLSLIFAPESLWRKCEGKHLQTTEAVECLLRKARRALTFGHTHKKKRGKKKASNKVKLLLLSWLMEKVKSTE